MKQIKEINFFEQKKSFDFENDFSATGKLKEKFDELGLVVLPADDPLNGKFGCLIYDQKTEDALTVYSKVFEDSELIVHDVAEDFFTILKDSLEKDYPTFSLNDPVRLRIGFLVLKNSGNKWHQLRLSEFKKYQSESDII